VEEGIADSKVEDRIRGASEKEVRRFVIKVLTVKTVQFVIECGYFFFVTELTAFEGASFWWLIVPVPVYLFVCAYVRVKKIPPYFATTLILILISSICFSYTVGIIYKYFGLDVISLPLSVLIVYLTYLLIIPWFMCNKMGKDMPLKKFLLIPMGIVWMQNLCLITIVASLLETDFYLIKTTEMLLVFSLPTVLCSSLAMGFSMLQLKQVIGGQCFRIVYEEHFKDHYYAALYLL
jgi:hypothetical protein